jgi:hypothetical protein
MSDYSLKDQLLGMAQSIVAFLPYLLAGLVLILIGWLLAWFARRLVSRICVLLRLERFLTSFRWGGDFARADIRYGLYNFLGSIAAAVVFVIFLENAFEAWQLKLLSKLLEKGISYLPKLVSAGAAFGLGWLIALWAAKAVQRTLLQERIPGATLIARFVKAVLLVFFSAMALVELDVARQVVVIGFSTVIVTLGAVVIVIVSISGKDLLRDVFETYLKSKQPGDS